MPEKADIKIESIDDVYDLRLGGWHEVQGKSGRWQMSKTGFFPLYVSKRITQENPNEFAEKIDADAQLIQKISERDSAPREGVTLDTEQNHAEPPEPAGALISLETQDMLVHDPARILLQSIILTEKLHLIPIQDRHELAFAGIGFDKKGKVIIDDKYDAKKNIRFSLADLAIYRLVDAYTRWKSAESEILDLSNENAGMKFELDRLRHERKQLMQAAFVKVLIQK